MARVRSPTFRGEPIVNLGGQRHSIAGAVVSSASSTDWRRLYANLAPINRVHALVIGRHCTALQERRPSYPDVRPPFSGHLARRECGEADGRISSRRMVPGSIPSLGGCTLLSRAGWSGSGLASTSVALELGNPPLRNARRAATVYLRAARPAQCPSLAMRSV